MERLVAEAADCDFKGALEKRKPKSWLKSVSAFANGIGGLLFFGVAEDTSIVGVEAAQADVEVISRLVKERITPPPHDRVDGHEGERQGYFVPERETWSLNAILL